MAIAMRTTLVVQTAKNVIGRIRTSDLRTADRLKNLHKEVSDGLCVPCVRLRFVFTKLIVLTFVVQTAFCFTAVYSGRICGNKITSRMLGASVSSITRRSSPMPQPPVGGRPYSMARM